MSSKAKVLLSGGTGFLGVNILPLLREKFDVDVISRSGKTEITADLSQWGAGLEIDTLQNKKYDLFLHTAGLYDLTASRADCYQHNVASMGIALKLAQDLKIPYFVNTSTVAAAINSRLDQVNPYDLDLVSPFLDPYSESKAFGEEIFKNWDCDYLKGKINLRLGVLIGDSQKGKIQRIDGIYHAIEAIRKIRRFIESSPKYLFFPGKEEIRIPLLPVDICAKAIVDICEWTLKNQVQGYKSLNLTPNQGLSVRDLYISALREEGIPRKNLVLVDKVPDKILKKISKLLARLPEEELNYLLTFPNYDNRETREILGDDWCPEFAQYENIIWRGYATYISNRGN